MIGCSPPHYVACDLIHLNRDECHVVAEHAHTVTVLCPFWAHTDDLQAVRVELPKEQWRTMKPEGWENWR